MGYNFKVIAVGSSAGGLPPLKQILGSIPPNINAAITIVQHLGSNYESKLAEILQRSSYLPVHKVDHNMEMEKGNVYVIGEGKVMSIADGMLIVRDRTAEERRLNKTIDQFFTSLSEEVGSQAIGIILSGAGAHDGIEGAMAIESRQGIVIVQEPYTAEHPIMPQALIANDHPDYILTPEDIARKIIQHCY
ncbi:chemotaxis protein CheB [Chitinophaga rhizophila]|uniref:protein-glutamate methylesterase n=1 Tax=Chitinophaga rhizophila TaxID=2866212 RepID=A0ABS7GBK8_9BACT|nr:chemotaxis protein CheB [Chitinophaga rhizophila]MBW8684645.1 chemotaxis protein CheB [Chitinophaga rhizophila]